MYYLCIGLQINIPVLFCSVLYIVFSVCLGLHPLRTKIYILFSVFLGLHALRTKNIVLLAFVWARTV